MAVPISQMWTVATYVLKQKLKGRKQYPLVLMLEPLFRCNLSCAGCGKIQYPSHVLKMQLTPEECFRADRKSTRLNSSHSQISYAVFCLKKKNAKVHGVNSTHPV